MNVESFLDPLSFLLSAFTFFFFYLFHSFFCYRETEDIGCGGKIVAHISATVVMAWI